MEKSQQERESEAGESQGLRGTLGTARQAVTRSFDRLTGAEFRRQFQEFTNVVTTTVLGIHRDQSELRDRVTRLEQRPGEDNYEFRDRLVGLEQRLEEEGIRPRRSLVAWVALILSLLAGLLGAIAVVRTL